MTSNKCDAYFFGRILGCEDFKYPTFCVWRVSAESSWVLIEGLIEGQTQTDKSDEIDASIWSHPFDFHYEFTEAINLPKFVLEVYQVDDYGRILLGGYGVVSLPVTPGHYTLDIDLWRPRGNKHEEMLSHYLGATSVLSSDLVIVNSELRSKIKTENQGKATIDLNVILGQVLNFPRTHG